MTSSVFVIMVVLTQIDAAVNAFKNETSLKELESDVKINTFLKVQS